MSMGTIGFQYLPKNVCISFYIDFEYKIKNNSIESFYGLILDFSNTILSNYDTLISRIDNAVFNIKLMFEKIWPN